MPFRPYDGVRTKGVIIFPLSSNALESSVTPSVRRPSSPRFTVWLVAIAPPSTPSMLKATLPFNVTAMSDFTSTVGVSVRPAFMSRSTTS